MKRPRPPQYVLNCLPHELQVRVREEWWRRNRRSWKFWGGVVVLCLSPFLGLWIGHRLGVRRPAVTSREMLVNVITIGGTLLPGFVLYWLTAGRIAARNLAVIIRGHGLCPSCGYDLRASPGRCPECGASGSVTPSA